MREVYRARKIEPPPSQPLISRAIKGPGRVRCIEVRPHIPSPEPPMTRHKRFLAGLVGATEVVMEGGPPGYGGDTG